MTDITHAVTCNNLVKVYGDSKTRALDSVTFSIPSRGIFVLIGRNGSGKTTLVRILATALEPTSGAAVVNGVDVISQPKRLREKIAIVPQEARPVPWMTPMQTVFSYLLWRGFSYGEAKRRARYWLERVGLGEYSNILNRKLSGGMKRKVSVATVLASEAEIVFLDEPTTGLDPISRRALWDLLKETGKERFTFLTTHYLEEAEALADYIGVLEKGRLVRIGTLEQLRQSVKHNYSVKLLFEPSKSFLEQLSGDVLADKDGFVRILTNEEEAFKIARVLSKGNGRFTINPVSIDDIFFYLISQERGDHANV
ncbi:MAG: ABC transporter ATP-binding protein [Candidatus Bathyarchaeota archaeon]|nr:ABC transporter ATP-binding protein [Candidatus Bathyarchaeota archaeon]